MKAQYKIPFTNLHMEACHFLPASAALSVILIATIIRLSYSVPMLTFLPNNQLMPDTGPAGLVVQWDKNVVWHWTFCPAWTVAEAVPEYGMPVPFPGPAHRVDVPDGVEVRLHDFRKVKIPETLKPGKYKIRMTVSTPCLPWTALVAMPWLSLDMPFTVAD